MPLTPGARLGPYEIASPLGAGGMGEVYRARDPRLGRDVAIKVLPSVLAQDADRLRRFESEARAIAALSHPHILAVYDIGKHEGFPYIVTELLEGETLRDRLTGRALPVRKAVELGIQLARGLAAAHDKGIVHRDLKPENVFVAHDGQAKILDFGLSKLAEPGPVADGSAVPTQTHHTEPGAVVGTAGYMSPEQVRGQPVDHRSDIFSLGAVLYEMLVGRRPFHRGTTAETMAAILNEEPPELTEINPGVPPGLSRILRHCLEKSPQERFASARDLAFDLEALSDPDSSTAGAGAAAGGWPGRFRNLGLGLLGSVVLVSLGFGLARATLEAPSAHYRKLTFRRGRVTAARFSPDGTYFLYSAAWAGGASRLYSTRVDVPGDQDLGLEGELVGVAGGELFALQGAGLLVRASLSGAGAREIEDGVSRADVSRDGSRIVIVRSADGKQRIECPPGERLYETPGAILATRLSPDGRRIAFIEEPNAGFVQATVKVVDLKGSVRTVASKWYTSVLVWSPRGDEVWYSAVDAEGGWGIYGSSLSGHERVLSLTAQTPWLHDTRGDGRAVVELSDSRLEVAGLAAGESRERDLSWLTEPQAYDIASDGKSVALTAVRPGRPGIPGLEGTDVYLAKFDASTPIRLGRGLGCGLSPDGRFVAAMTEDGLRALDVLPTGAGATRRLPAGSIRYYTDARWLPDGRSLLITANEEGRPKRLFLQGLSGGPPVAMTPEGVQTDYPIPSPDGKWVAAGIDWRTAPYLLYPMTGGEAQPIAGLAKGEEPLRFDADGTHLFIRTDSHTEPLVRVERLDLRSGRREPWREIRPLDPSGVASASYIYLTPDGHGYVYDYDRRLSTLYLVEGLK